MLQNLQHDTYTVSAELGGNQVEISGVTVQQEITVPLNFTLARPVKTIVRVRTNTVGCHRARAVVIERRHPALVKKTRPAV